MNFNKPKCTWVRPVSDMTMEMVMGWEYLSYEDRLRNLGLFIPEKRRLQGGLIAAFQFLKGAYKKGQGQLF